MYGINEVARNARRHALTRTEEARLHAAYLSGDHAAGQRLVNSFLPVIMKNANAYGMPAGHRQDMLGVAVKAFMENLFRYDPTKGYRIWTYMQLVVRHAVSEYASANRSFFKLTTPQDKAALAHLEGEKKKLGACGRALTGSETRYLAAVFGVSESIIHGLDDNMAVMRPESLRNERHSRGPDVDDPERAGGHLDFETSHDHDLHMERLRAGLELLSPQQRDIVTRRFKETPDTLQELADEIGVSRERIRQIEGVALRILRHAIENPGKDKASNAALLRRYADGKHGKSRAGGTTYVATTRRSTKAKTARRGGARRPARKTRREAVAAEQRTRARP